MYLYFEATAVLYTLTVITVLFLVAGILSCAVLLKKGKAKSLHHGINVGEIIKAFFIDVVLQLQILKISFVRWFMHMCIFIGFMGLLAQTTVMAFMSHFLPQDSPVAGTFFDAQGGTGARVLDVWGDVFGIMLLTGLAVAVIRRYVIKTKQLDTIVKDTMSLCFLSAITVTGFLCEAFRLMDPQYADVAVYSFAGNFLAHVLTAIGIGAMDYHAWVW
ncbi:MAG: hypothetical protein GF350_10400, partial [Chitinivibrionales bacterium]|nr:hypothetical protein [Chitinivibrionales bacterium]